MKRLVRNILAGISLVALGVAIYFAAAATAVVTAR